MGELLDQVLLDGLRQCGLQYAQRSFGPALAALASLAPAERMAIVRCIGGAHNSIVRTRNAEVPSATEDEAIFGLLMTEATRLYGRGSPAQLSAALVERSQKDPASLQQATVQWRQGAVFKLLNSYDDVPESMRRTLDRSLERMGYPPLHDDPDALTLAKGLSLAMDPALGFYPKASAFTDLGEPERTELIGAIVESQDHDTFRSTFWWRHALGCLAVSDLDALRPHLARLAEAGVLVPTEVYWTSGAAPARALLRRVLNNSTTWQARESLVWTRHEPSMIEALRAKARSPAELDGWKTLARLAGAQLSDTGRLSELALQECRWLVPVRGEQVPDGPQLMLLTPNEHSCPGCGRGMSVIIDLDLRAPECAELASIARDSDPEPTRLRLLGCLACAYYHDPHSLRVTATFDWQGGIALGVNDGIELTPVIDSDEELGFVREVRAVLLRDPSLPIAAALGHGESRSHVGCYPRWDQDAEYPVCPSCGMTMVFIASMSMLDFDGGDPTTYCCICVACRLSCVSVQTT